MNINSTLLQFLKTILLLFLLLLGIFSKSYSQKQANLWYFGNSLGLDFNNGGIKITQAFSGQFANAEEEGHATVCDENGNFLFYTNGVTVWNKNAGQMQNGAGLDGHASAAQCATIFPLPGSTKSSALSKYVILTTPVAGSGSIGIKYNIVDMDPSSNGNHTTGAVIIKNNAMPNPPVSATEGLVSCPHWNGRDEWVVAHDETNKFYAWKVGTDALGNIAIANPIISTIGDNVSRVVIMKFNNCFNKLAMTNHVLGSSLQVFSFDNQTGIVGNFDNNPSGVNGVLKLDVSKTVGDGSTGAAGGNYGIEFSPNGQYLFISQSGQEFAAARSQRLYRYDIQTGTPTLSSIEASRTTLFSREGTDNSHRIGHLQLAPNGKIYMTHMFGWNANDGGKLSVINNPNDAAHNFSLESIVFATGRSTMGLPSFHKGFLSGSASISAADSTGTTSLSDLGEICVGIATMFENRYTGTGINYTWDMAADATPARVEALYGYSNPTPTKAYHRYDTPGDYLIVTTVEDATCGFIIKDTATITVNSKINTTGQPICGNPNITLNVTPTPSASKKFVWYSDALLTAPLGAGASITVPAPLLSNVYVKEVETVTITPTLISAAIPVKTDSISKTNILTLGAGQNSTTTTNPTTTYNSASPNPAATTTLVVSNTLTLNYFHFLIEGAWGAATVNYTVSIKNSGGTAVWGPTVISGDVRRDRATKTIGSSIKLTIGGSSRIYFQVSPGVTLSPGTYTVEISKSGGTAANANASLLKFPTTLTGPSMTRNITNNGSGGSPATSYLFNISVTTTALPDIIEDVITSTNKVCSYTGIVPVNCPLPVKFIYVNASPERLITWATAMEINNNYFVIERSFDGKNFSEIGRVNSSGNSNAVTTYSFTDTENFNEHIYYRIMQVDYNGQSSYSDIVAVASKDINSISIYPNPNKGDFTIKVDQKNASDIKVDILNIVGNVVYSDEISSGGSAVNLNLTYLSKGAYFVRTSDDFSSTVNKLIIE